MKTLFQLTPTKPQLSIGVNYHVDVLYVDNPTSSPILVRVGAPQIPQFDNADYTVPALSAKTLPVQSQEFGVTFLDPNLLTVLASGNVTTTATIQVQTRDEPLPNFGAANYQSISVSELLQGYTALSGPFTTGVFDIGAWGGALVSLIPDSGSGQGVIDVQASDNGTTFRSIGVWAFWPNVPVIIQIPRTVRRFRVIFNATAIPGEPAISGVYSVRATIAEIQAVEYNAGSAAFITNAYAIGVGGTFTHTLCTVGLPALNVALLNTSGTRGQLAIYTGKSATGPWAFVAEREQSLAGAANSIFRSIGQLDLFTQVRVLDTGATGLTGSLTFTIPSQADLAGALNRIHASLGDPLQTPNVNQSIYHVLDTIRLQTDTVEATLTTISSQLTTANSNLAQINTSTAQINLNTDTLESLITTSNSNLSAINTDLDTMVNAINRSSFPYNGENACIGNVWLNTTVQIANQNRINAIQMSAYIPAANQAGIMRLAMGTVAAPVFILYQVEAQPSWVPTSTFTIYTGPVISYAGTYFGGFIIPNGFNYVWVLLQQSGIATWTIIS